LHKSNPSSNLSWYINGEPANDVYLRRYSSTKNNPPKLGLSFPLTSNHFVNNNNRVQLKCLASIANFYWKSAEVTLLQEKPKFASVMTSGDDVQVEKAEVIGSSSACCCGSETSRILKSSISYLLLLILL